MNAAVLMRALPSLVGMLPPGARRLLATMLDVAAGAHQVGPPPPPSPVLERLNASAAAHELEPELLHALAFVHGEYSAEFWTDQQASRAGATLAALIRIEGGTVPALRELCRMLWPGAGVDARAREILGAYLLLAGRSMDSEAIATLRQLIAS